MVVKMQAPSSTMSRNGRALEANISRAGPVRPHGRDLLRAGDLRGCTRRAGGQNTALEHRLNSPASANTPR
jgi:hypothetical protein